MTIAFTDGRILDWENPEAKKIFWHSSAHLMAEALEALYPGVKFGVGPAVENGFYYDVDFGGRQISDSDLEKVENKMKELAKGGETFECRSVSKTEAMEYFKLIGDKNYYEKAYKLDREGTLQRMGFLTFLVIIAVIVLVVWLAGKAGKYNERLTEHPHTGKFLDEVIFGLYVMRHPFNGHWALKMEKRGSVRAATFWMGLTAVSAIFASLGACYLQKDEGATVISALSNTVFPLLLLIVSNMCFTTLMDGKGTFKDTYIAVSYATVPYAICTIPLTLLSHALISDELSILNLFTSVILAWVLMLVFCGLMSVHDYSFGKNILVSALTVAGIAFMLFILIIFLSLTGKVISLITSIVTEVSYRS